MHYDSGKKGFIPEFIHKVITSDNCFETSLLKMRSK